MKRLLIILSLALLTSFSSSAQNKMAEEFKPAADSLSVLLKERTTVDIPLRIRRVMKRGNTLDIYFTQTLGDIPWREAEYSWFRSQLKSLFPEKYRKYNLGSIFSDRVNLKELPMKKLKNDGLPFSDRFRTKEHSRGVSQLVTRKDRPSYNKGLSNRHIALWQSHGRYYEQVNQRWQWQRPCLFQTCEDMFTQGFVLPFLVPMLENAGANTLLPRERDTQVNEVIADNDPMFHPDSVDFLFYGSKIRSRGVYQEHGQWEDAGIGFADKKAILTGNENPFEQGTARMAECINKKTDKKFSEIIWTMEVQEKGDYAVYVSYKSLKNSTSGAAYKVSHLGGTSEFIVNQKIGGGTWIYLGTFTFSPEEPAIVHLSNLTPQGVEFHKGNVVTADAVRIGGGMGNIARRHFKDTSSIAELSGFPRYVEGARYSMQWYGVDSTVYSQNEQLHDYRDDFMSRGAWTGWLSGGSEANPKGEGLGIPIDLSLGMHTDAGVTPNDSIIGTLAIYTLRCENKRKLPDGDDRMSCREFTDIMQTQIVDDIRAQIDPEWNRRGTWDRSYSESRTPAVPATLLELLSHQNFADMKLGHDPQFRFIVARSIYKSILKYLSNLYGKPYAVQPLPVNSFAAEIISANEVELSWMPTEDRLEPTAKPKGYILYTRINGGGFDTGRILSNIRQSEDGRLRASVPLSQGAICSYRISAYNEGGESFPSETLSAGIPTGGDWQKEKSVLIVNNFTRVSAPAWYDTPEVAGFNNSLDSGVPYINDITFIGEQYQNIRRDIWTDDENPGFGASHQDYAGKKVAGNSFDYPAVHGASVMKAGHAFSSASASAFASVSELQEGWFAADIICGKQVTTVSGARDSSPDFQVFPIALQEAIGKFTRGGGNLIVSGAYIGTDIWSNVYPAKADSTYTADSKKFVRDVLGYRWASNSASRKAEVLNISKEEDFWTLEKRFDFCNEINDRTYSVESPDGINPSKKSSKPILRYTDSGQTAAIAYDAENYKTFCIGFPIESIENETVRDNLIRCALKYFY